MSKGWDNAMIKKLKALTGKGLSTAEIGRKLGLSKNAVVGKLNRLGWNSKASGGVAAEKAPKAEANAKKNTVAKKTVAAVKPAKKTEAVAKKTTEKSTAAAVKKVAEKVAPSKKPVAKKATVTEKTTKSGAEPKEKEEKKSSSTKGLDKSLAMHQRIIQHSLEMASLKPNQCRWPIGDPDSEDFHFCGETVFVGKPYCYEHCKQAYQFTPPKKK